MAAGADDLYNALALLGELLEGRGAPPVELVVCGGVALRVAGIVRRVTKDVDVLARRGEVDRELMGAWPLPEQVTQAAVEVAEELGLPGNWLNATASMLGLSLDDLPPALWSGLIEKDYGPCLRIGFVGRAGQIYLKIHAAVGREEMRDVADLKALAPTPGEWQTVAGWMERCGLLDDAKRKRLAELEGEVRRG